MAPENPSTPVADDGELATPQGFRRSSGFFIENRGQVSEEIRYYSKGNPSVAFRDDGIMFVLRERRDTDWGEVSDLFALNREGTGMRSVAYLLRFEGSSNVTPTARGRLPFNSNFFIGSESIKWRTNVPNFEEIVYEGLYEGIDLLYRPYGRGAKYEFVIRPGAHPDTIRMKYDGVESLQLDSDGLLAQTVIGDVRDSAPISFQKRGRVDCGFVRLGRFSFGYDCLNWDASDVLVIDPLIYSTFLGGSEGDGAGSIAVDEYGNTFVVGGTTSDDFPVTPGVYDMSINDPSPWWSDVFVSKLDATGSSLLYATYIGGNGTDSGYAVTVDVHGNAYAGGMTAVSDFPTTPGAFQTTRAEPGTWEGWVAKLNPNGSALVYSTYIGATNSEAVLDIEVDSNGNAYFTGTKSSSDFPVTEGAYNTTRIGSSEDVFLMKLNPNGSEPVFSTYFGGEYLDRGTSIEIDAEGIIYIAGVTVYPDFPVTPNAFDTTYNGGLADAFLVKLSANASELLYSTFLGGSNSEYGLYSCSVHLALDSTGNVYMTGKTNSTDFPVTPGALDTSLGDRDAYVLKLSGPGDSLVYSTFLGGAGREEGCGIAVDPAGVAYVVGWTDSPDFPVTPGAFDTVLNVIDIFLTRIDANGTSLVYSTYIGGSSWGDKAGGIKLDEHLYVYLSGGTYSDDFPVTPGAFDTTHDGTVDGFILKLLPVMMTEPVDLTVTRSDIAFAPPGPVDESSSVTIEATVHNVGGSNASDVTVRFYDGLPAGSNQIGTDQVIPFVEYLGGNDQVSVIWPSSGPGLHDICAFADPDDTINESNEFNNLGCAPIEVLPPPTPDLSVSPSEIVLFPLPPLTEGDTAQVTATIRNIGNEASGMSVARFHDGVPPSPIIGPDQPLPSISVGGAENVTVLWTSSQPGDHEICIFADPEDLVAESNESNNIACTDADVLPRPITKPDYAPTNAQPSNTIKIGLFSTVNLSIEVFNAGNESAPENVTVAFYNQTTPSIPHDGFTLEPLPPSMTSSPFHTTWTSPGFPGTYGVSFDVDYHNNITEWNETNNVYDWTLEVVSGPTTSLIVREPSYTSNETYVKSSTPLDFSVADESGAGTSTMYRIDGGEWVNYTLAGQFNLVGEGEHLVEWSSKDYVGNLEVDKNATLWVDDTPPVTDISPVSGDFTDETMFVLTAVDLGSGVNVTTYMLDSDERMTYGSGFSLPAGTHIVTYYSIDNLGNDETPHTIQIDIRGEPPHPPKVRDNFKPVVALMFSILIAASAAYSAKKRPLQRFNKKFLQSWALLALLPMVAEGVTGVLSLWLEPLWIPPLLGWGMAVDCLILLGAVLYLLLRLSRGRRRTALSRRT